MLEFSANDKRDAPFSDPERKGYEQLARKLLRLPSRPALVQLHHYAWWHAVGDGIDDGGLFYHPAGEAQLGVLAHVRAVCGGWRGTAGGRGQADASQA